MQLLVMVRIHRAPIAATVNLEKVPRRDAKPKKRARDWSRGGEPATPIRTESDRAELSAQEIARRALEDARRKEG